MNDAETQDLLFSRVCDGLASAEEISALHRLLSTDTGALDAWLRYNALHQELASGAAMQGLQVLSSPVKSRVAASPQRRFWSQWRPLTSAAAGITIGLFAASMVWAYVVPLTSKTITLLEDGFESDTPSLATRVPLEPGIWRGDHADIVAEEQGIKPLAGHKMLRFLRADHDGKARVAGNHIADVYQLIDVRQFRHEFADGSAVAQASASVNATAFPVGEKYGCAISIYALDAETVPDSAAKIGTALTNEANAMARSGHTKLDRDPTQWQQLSTELRLPPNTEFLVVRLHITQGFDSTGNATFTGSYADEVKVTLTRRTSL